MKKKAFVSLFVPCAIACALAAVGCSQGPGEEPAAASSDAIVSSPCARQINPTAPLSGTASYAAVGAQYGTSACGAFAITVTNNRSIVANATLAGASAISAAECATIVADLKVVDYETIVNDCSDVPQPCKPSVKLQTTVLGEKTVKAAMVSTSHGLECQLPAATLSTSWSGSSPTETLKLLVSAHASTPTSAYLDMNVNVTTH
jgi:hypothetical protein